MSLFTPIWQGMLWSGIWRGGALPPEPPTGNWILRNSAWDDSGNWIDSEVWNG